ncbi:MAG: hypothetical protein ACE5JA_02275, partial [bacterium]
MKKRILLPVALMLAFSGGANARDIDLLRQGARKLIPHSYGCTAPKTGEDLSANHIGAFPSGLPNIIQWMSLPADRFGALDYMPDDIVIGDTVVISQDTTIYGNIILINNGQLIVRDCSFHLKGSITALHNSLFSVENASFTFLQDFIYQFMMAVVDSAAIEMRNSVFNSSNFPSSCAVIHSGSLVMDSVNMTAGFITFATMGNGSIDVVHSDRAGEFVVLGDSAQVHIAHSDTVLVWLGFPRGSSGELHGSPAMGDWVEQFIYPDSTCSGIDYSIRVDSIYGLILATMAMDSTIVTVYDAELQSSGNIFELPVIDTISGLVDESHYDDCVVPLPQRYLRLVNTSIRAWNLYFYDNTELTLRNSIFGECLAADSSRPTIMNATCDGFGGHIGASGSSFFLSFLTSLYTDALMEGHSLSMFFLTNFALGKLIAQDRAVSLTYNSIMSSPALVYDSATVMVTGLYPPSPAYVNDTLSVQGSAAMLRAPGSPFNFEAYRVEYSPSEDTAQFFAITGRVHIPVEDGELCKFITNGLDVGSYIIRLWYFFSAFGTDDSLSFDNTLYLGSKPGIRERPESGRFWLWIHPTLLSSAAQISYSIPYTTEIELSLYNI